MCTTIAELRIDTYSQRATWAHWGDTRVYWFRNHELRAMTKDHSVVQSLVAAGLISNEEALTYPKRNVLLGAAGSASEVGPSVLENPVAVTNGDAFLICTDGVWSMVSTQFMETSLSKSVSVQDWVNTSWMKWLGLVVAPTITSRPLAFGLLRTAKKQFRQASNFTVYDRSD